MNRASGTNPGAGGRPNICPSFSVYRDNRGGHVSPGTSPHDEENAMTTYCYQAVRERKQAQRPVVPVHRCTRCDDRYVNIDAPFCPRCDLKRYEERERRQRKHGPLRAA